MQYRNIEIKRIRTLLVALACGLSLQANAAPLPDNTLLTLEPGVLTGSNDINGCASGSCAGYQQSPGIYIWYSINPGTDGGIILGKDQSCGGQNTNSSSTMPGEITTAAPMFFTGGIPATFCTTPMTSSGSGVVTSDASANIFDDTSCSGAGCLSKTHLGTWHTAWNANAIPLGSAGGCLGLNCTADQLAGIDVTDWSVIDNMDGSFSYGLEYSWPVPDGDPSGFGNVEVELRLAGNILLPDTPELSGVWKSSSIDVLFLFGEHLTNVTELLVNGVNLTNSINPADPENRLLLVLAPGLTPPYNVSITTSQGVAVFPPSCP